MFWWWCVFFLNIRPPTQYHWPFKDGREGPHSQNLMTFRCILTATVNLHLSNWPWYSTPHCENNFLTEPWVHWWASFTLATCTWDLYPHTNGHETKIFLKCRPKGGSPFLSCGAAEGRFPSPVLSWVITWIPWPDLVVALPLPDIMGWTCCSSCPGAVGPSPMVSSLLVLFLPLSHPPQWRPLPLLSPGIFPQWDQGKGRADGSPFWCNLRPERKVLGTPTKSVFVTRFPDPYTAGLCLP